MAVDSKPSPSRLPTAIVGVERAGPFGPPCELRLGRETPSGEISLGRLAAESAAATWLAAAAARLVAETRGLERALPFAERARKRS